jgi:hypothetical protein
VSVAVHDGKTGEAFDLPVRDGERAIDVFRHPYAYAARSRRTAAESAGQSDLRTRTAVP